MNLENAPSDAPRIASPWARIAAALLDGIILFPVGILVVFFSSRSWKFALFVFPVYQLLYVSYQAFFHSRYGATLGKMALKMQVVNEDYSKIDFYTALKRISVEGVLQGALMILSVNMFLSLKSNFPVTNMMDFAKMIQVGPYHTVNMLEGGWDYLGIMSCLFSQKRKALHDYIAGTVVIQKRS
jgi:uncharacterized RDD family membrane protein YckC